jgi:hypothetical protein
LQIGIFCLQLVHMLFILREANNGKKNNWWQITNSGWFLVYDWSVCFKKLSDKFWWRYELLILYSSTYPVDLFNATLFASPGAQFQVAVAVELECCSYVPEGPSVERLSVWGSQWRVVFH